MFKETDDKHNRQENERTDYDLVTITFFHKRMHFARRMLDTLARSHCPGRILHLFLVDRDPELLECIERLNFPNREVLIHHLTEPMPSNPYYLHVNRVMEWLRGIDFKYITIIDSDFELHSKWYKKTLEMVHAFSEHRNIRLFTVFNNCNGTSWRHSSQQVFCEPELGCYGIKFDVGSGQVLMGKSTFYDLGLMDEELHDLVWGFRSNQLGFLALTTSPSYAQHIGAASSLLSHDPESTELLDSALDFCGDYTVPMYLVGVWQLVPVIDSTFYIHGNGLVTLNRDISFGSIIGHVSYDAITCTITFSDRMYSFRLHDFLRGIGEIPAVGLNSVVLENLDRSDIHRVFVHNGVDIFKIENTYVTFLDKLPSRVNNNYFQMMVNRNDVILSNASIDEVIRRIDASGFTLYPILTEENYHGFNIVRYLNVIYAVSLALGNIDFYGLELTEDKVRQLAMEKLFFVSDSVTKLKKMIKEALRNPGVTGVHSSNSEGSTGNDDSIQSNAPETPMPLFSFLIPTRGRPDLVARLFQSIVDTTSNLANLEIVLAIDDDDELSKSIRDERINFKTVVVPKGLSMGALNQACYRASSGRYIMLMNDDVVLRTPGWDRVVSGAFNQFRDDIALIHVNDLLFREKLCTFPFLSRVACEMIGLCPDVYQRYKIDDHIYEIYSMLAHLGHKRIIYLPEVIFEHENHAAQAGPDASEQHVFVSQDNKMYVPHGPTIEMDDKAFTERNEERKALALRLAAYIEKYSTQAQHEKRLEMFADKLRAIKEPYLFRKQSFLTVQPGIQQFSSVTHRTTIAVVCSDIRKEMTQHCITALKEHTNNYDLIVLDNAGNREFSHPSEMNKVLKSVTTDFLVLMDDDVFVEAGWLDGLLKCIDDTTAVVAPYHKGKASFSGAYLMGDGQGNHAHTIDMPATPREMQCYCSAIILIDVRKVGHLLMEEKYAKYFFDLVHGFMVWEAGFRAVCTPEVVVTHVGGGTMAWPSSSTSMVVELDRKYFVEDWIESGRLHRLEQGIWQEYPYLKLLVDVPAEIKATCRHLSLIPPMDQIHAINRLLQAAGDFDLFRRFINEQLEAHIQNLKSLDEYDAETSLAFGIYCYEIGCYMSSLQLLTHSTNLDSHNAEAWFWIAIIGKAFNNLSLFNTAIEHAKKRDPYHPLLLKIMNMT